MTKTQKGTMNTGIHTVDEADYHADPTAAISLSASIAHILLSRSPRHAWNAHPKLNPAYQAKESGTLDHGTAAHMLLFEGKAASIIDGFADWRKKEAQELRAQARASGLVPLLRKDATTVNALCEAISTQLDALDCDPRPFTDGKAEQTLVWREANGITCRARLDWLRDDHALIEDLKTTTTANPRDWTRRRLWEDGKDIQAAFYLRGLRTLTGKDADWRFIVVENTPPYALSVISLNPDARALADAKVEKAIALWRDCLDTNHWPAYPARVCYAELPPWEEARWLEQQALEELEATV